jgi:hypothetical protein
MGQDGTGWDRMGHDVVELWNGAGHWVGREGLLCMVVVWLYICMAVRLWWEELAVVVVAGCGAEEGTRDDGRWTVTGSTR